MIASGSLHNYKNTFQKQERNEDFGVDMYEFKYRMDDPQIGRFCQIDPLADDYVYNSTYAFSENKVTSGRELEGLEYEQLVEEEEVEVEVEAEALSTYVEHAVDIAAIGIATFVKNVSLSDVSPSAVAHMGPAITTVAKSKSASTVLNAISGE